MSSYPSIHLLCVGGGEYNEESLYAWTYITIQKLEKK
jgi:hypothetical protein